MIMILPWYGCVSKGEYNNKKVTNKNPQNKNHQNELEKNNITINNSHFFYKIGTRIPTR